MKAETIQAILNEPNCEGFVKDVAKRLASDQYYPFSTWVKNLSDAEVHFFNGYLGDDEYPTANNLYQLVSLIGFLCAGEGMETSGSPSELKRQFIIFRSVMRMEQIYRIARNMEGDGIIPAPMYQNLTFGDEFDPEAVYLLASEGE